jgi:hypothetical protein
MGLVMVLVMGMLGEHLRSGGHGLHVGDFQAPWALTGEQLGRSRLRAKLSRWHGRLLAR